jgi:hypothetical protein
MLNSVEVVSYLEPFLIYTDDLTFKQYQEITQFIDEKISSYNKNMINLSRIFKIISTTKQSPLLKSQAFSVIEIINANLRHEIFDSYGLENPESNMTNSEILRRLIIKDYSRLYTSTISLQNLNES